MDCSPTWPRPRTVSLPNRSRGPTGEAAPHRPVGDGLVPSRARRPRSVGMRATTRVAPTRLRRTSPSPTRPVPRPPIDVKRGRSTGRQAQQPLGRRLAGPIGWRSSFRDPPGRPRPSSLRRALSAPRFGIALRGFQNGFVHQRVHVLGRFAAACGQQHRGDT